MWFSSKESALILITHTQFPINSQQLGESHSDEISTSGQRLKLSPAGSYRLLI